MKKCPYCAEEIQDDAIVCKHCGRDLRVQIQQPMSPAKPLAKKSNAKLVWIIIGLLAFSACCLFLIFAQAVKPATWSDLNSTSGGHTITYSVTGSAPVSFVTYMNASGGMEQKDVNLPFKLEFNAKSGAMLSIVAQNKGDSGSITCQILVDGQVKKEATSSGGYVVVTCSDVMF